MSIAARDRHRGAGAPAGLARRVTPPSRQLLRWFRWYLQRYLKRHFRTVRVRGEISIPLDEPLILYSNHPSWWDPLICTLVAQHLIPDREVFAPMESAGLARYPFFRRLGVFGVDPGAAGAKRFLQDCGLVLRRRGAALWITPQGRFADARERPLGLKRGLAQLAARTAGAWVVPIAIEYAFGEDRLPHALALVGESIQVTPGTSVSALHDQLTEQLERSLDELKRATISRRFNGFETLLEGSRSTGGVYGLLERLRERCGPRQTGETSQ